MRRSRKVLLGINVVLLAALAGATLAQPTGGVAGRGRGQYVIVSGRITSGTGNPIYIVDTVNEEMIALKWDRSAQRLETIGFRDLQNDAQTGGRAR